MFDMVFNLKFQAKQLNRQAAKCEKNEKAEKDKAFKAMKKNNMDGAQIYASNAIRLHNENLQFLRIASQCALHRLLCCMPKTLLQLLLHQLQCSAPAEPLAAQPACARFAHMRACAICCQCSHMPQHRSTCSASAWLNRMERATRHLRRRARHWATHAACCMQTRGHCQQAGGSDEHARNE